MIDNDSSMGFFFFLSFLSDMLSACSALRKLSFFVRQHFAISQTGFQIIINSNENVCFSLCTLHNIEMTMSETRGHFDLHY